MNRAHLFLDRATALAALQHPLTPSGGLVTKRANRQAILAIDEFLAAEINIAASRAEAQFGLRNLVASNGTGAPALLQRMARAQLRASLHRNVRRGLGLSVVAVESERLESAAVIAAVYRQPSPSPSIVAANVLRLRVALEVAQATRSLASQSLHRRFLSRISQLVGS
ncbi:MAG: hypothetical protein KF745_12875 [Phycisphaeraceae bacterium]|nr:hypothetical protein [Phycisphaeraceae bacterium]